MRGLGARLALLFLASTLVACVDPGEMSALRTSGEKYEALAQAKRMTWVEAVTKYNAEIEAAYGGNPPLSVARLNNYRVVLAQKVDPGRSHGRRRNFN